MKKRLWEEHFPHKVIRPQQDKAIEFALKAFDSGKKYVLAEIPVGGGKSAIAVTLAKLYREQSKSSYILTTQKILQEQYKKEFDFLANVSAKQNYTCTNRLGQLSCEFGIIIESALSKNKEQLQQYKKKCCYYKDKNAFDVSSVSMTNLHYFLSHSGLDISERDLLVIDECHNVEQMVVEYASIEFTKYITQEILGLKWINASKMKVSDVVGWINEVYLPKLNTIIGTYVGKVSSNSDDSFLTSHAGMSMLKKVSDMQRVRDKIQKLVDDFREESWILTVSDSQDVLSIKPLYARNYTNSLLYKFGKKVLLMSGTILDKKTYCYNVGIPEEQTEFLSIESPFDAKSRPVYILGSGSMSKKNITQTLPVAMDVINEIIDEHKTEKGIIHCNAYHIAKYIEDNINNKRLLFHSNDDRQDILDLHLTTKKPTILVSPSMTEGIDLKDELSRFQIIVKLPFPYLGDNYIKTKMERIPNWYVWQTTKTLIQSCGRSVRNEKDWCTTYIIDSDIIWFYNRNKNMFPEWFSESLIFS